MKRLGTTNIEVFPLCLGGNVFGWSADENESFAVLDAYAAAGGNFIDTADVYSEWNGTGGISETIIGKWMQSRGNREQMVIATKVGSLSTRPGLSADNIKAACNGSLQRLQSDYIDVYFAHRDFDQTPLEETLTAFDGLVREGKVRVLGASNYSGERIEEALKLSEQNSLASYAVIQNQYNLMERAEYEEGMADVVARHSLASTPYFSLAMGFLTGKYRAGTKVESVRAGGAERYLDDRGNAVLMALDEIAASHSTTVAAVALAWLAAQPNIAAPIASARTEEQVAGIVAMAHVQLDERELKLLGEASAAE